MSGQSQLALAFFSRQNATPTVIKHSREYAKEDIQGLSSTSEAMEACLLAQNEERKISQPFTHAFFVLLILIHIFPFFIAFQI